MRTTNSAWRRNPSQRTLYPVAATGYLRSSAARFPEPITHRALTPRARHYGKRQNLLPPFPGVRTEFTPAGPDLPGTENLPSRALPAWATPISRSLQPRARPQVALSPHLRSPEALFSTQSPPSPDPVLCPNRNSPSVTFSLATATSPPFRFSSPAGHIVFGAL